MRLKQFKLFCNCIKRQGSHITKSILVITSHSKQFKPVQVKEYKYFEVPCQWFNLPSVLLPNIIEVIMTTRSTSVDLVAISKARQIVPEVSTIKNSQLFHHLRSN